MDATLPAPFDATHRQDGRRSSTQLTLQPGAMLHLRRVQGLQVQVQVGRIWLTHSGELDDHILGEGQGLALEDGRDVLIECDGASPAQLRWWVRRPR